MSLSTQLTRGTLALPMLVLFGVLALVCGEPVDASIPEAAAAPAGQSRNDSREDVLVAGRRLVLEARNAEAGCNAHLRPAMLLAPADLGPIAQRQGSCRA
jgi:hypothetical protein